MHRCPGLSFDNRAYHFLGVSKNRGGSYFEMLCIGIPYEVK